MLLNYPLGSIIGRYPTSNGDGKISSGIINHNWKCRDLAFLVLFIAFWVAMIVNSSFAKEPTGLPNKANRRNPFLSQAHTLIRWVSLFSTYLETPTHWIVVWFYYGYFLEGFCIFGFWIPHCVLLFWEGLLWVWFSVSAGSVDCYELMKWECSMDVILLLVVFSSLSLLLVEYVWWRCGRSGFPPIFMSCVLHIRINILILMEKFRFVCHLS